MASEPKNAFEAIMSAANKRDCELLVEKVTAEFPQWQTFLTYAKNVEQAIADYEETGIEPTVSFKNWQSGTLEPRDSVKENLEPNALDTPPRARPRRNAAREASQLISKQSQVTLSTKLRQDDGKGVHIKKEKLSILNKLDSEKEPEARAQLESVKQEKEDMPAPTKPAPKSKRQAKKTSKAIKQEKLDVVEESVEQMDKCRDSDVVIHDVPVTTVDITDSDEDKQIKKPTRSTRTKQKKKASKRSRQLISDDEENVEDTKRSKSDEVKEENVTAQTLYEDAVSTVEEPKEANNATYVQAKPETNATFKQMKQNSDHTFVVQSPQEVNVNTTIVVAKPKVVQNNAKVLEDLMTDDESEDEDKPTKRPPRMVPTKIPQKPSTSKQIFNPFDQSPVKKKVQAFEKLNEEANVQPMRVTRTKTRALAKEQQQKEETQETNNVDAVGSNNVENKSTLRVKEKSKVFTPAAARFQPKAHSTTSKLMPTNSSDSLLAGKSISAVKASQAEYREREKRRREKEEEAVRKREALLQSQMEEKKKKNEEKRLKAQQQREILEKERLKGLSLQRQKEEKHKKLIQEQEEKKLKMREEAEKKRMMIKMKAIEEKKKEEEKRLEEQREFAELTARMANKDAAMAKLAEKHKMQREKQLPAYMVTKAPLLPTKDCYDSDSELYTGEKIKEPSWAKDSVLPKTQLYIMAAGEAIKNSFFSRKAMTPDLVDIFENIDANKLKRSSSAIWHKPPRYTMVPPTLMESFQEYPESDFED